jgi:hypothetical protein
MVFEGKVGAGAIISMMPTARTKRIAAVSAAGAVVLASAYYFASGSRSVPSNLAPFVPPVYPGAILNAEKSDVVQGGRQHLRLYTVKGATEDLLGFYRKELTARGLHMVAQGGGPYGGFLQAADDGGNRAVFVEVDAPEDKPGEPAKITMRVIDKK